MAAGAETQVAAQRNGHGPDVATVEGQTAAEALAATRAAAANVHAAPAIVAPTITVGAINIAAAGILGALDKFLDESRTEQETHLETILHADAPGLSVSDVHEIVSDELDREQQFAGKMRARLQSDLPAALALSDPVERAAAVQALIEREQGYLAQHEAAVASRALGTAEQRMVEQQSPEGGYWKLSAHVEQHDEECLAMAGKVWPHSVLRNHHPPLHTGCPCELWTVQKAKAAGLPLEFVSHDQSIVSTQVTEAQVDEALAIIEAYDARWSKGTTKAGEFRPRRGGDPGAVLRARRLQRLHLHDVAPVTAIGDELDVRDIKTSDLKVGDRVMVGGGLERVESVDEKTPGLLTLEHTGLVHIDRDTVRGVPAEGTPDHGGHHGLPILPAAGADDRFELRYGPNASLVMHDRESGKPYATWDEWDLPTVKGILDEHNHDHREALRDREPPPPSPTGGPTHADILKLARMRQPEPGVITTGFRHNPDLQGVAATIGDELHLPTSFFSRPTDERERVLFAHLGSQLAEGLGDKGVDRLAEQDPSLRSSQAVAETYKVLNTSDRQRVTTMRPDAARLVAAAAVERSLPLHPEAAKLARRPLAADEPPADHPVHALARSVEGLHGSEARDRLQAAGYQFAASTPDELTFRNHDAGAAITLHGSPTVTSVTPEIAPAVDPEERRTLVGETSQSAISRLTQEGYAPNYTVSGKWLSLVHPDGRGRAIAFEGDGVNVTDAKAFTATPREAHEAGEVVYRANPLRAIKPGDDFEHVRSMLDSPISSYRMAESGMAGDDSNGHTVPPLPDGVQGYTKFGHGPDAIVVHHADDSRTGKRVIVNAGLADPRPEHPGRIVSASEHSTLVAAQEADEERKRTERRAASDSADAALRDGLATANTDQVKAALAGKNVSEAASAIKAMGFELRGRRRSRDRTTRQQSITYTLRGPDAVTVKITGPLTFGHAPFSKLEVAGNPQDGSRARLPEGQAPKTLDELLTDTLGRADELGARFDAGVHVTGVVEGGVSSGAAAHHEFNGTIAIRKSGEAKRIKAYLAARKKGGHLTDHQHLGFYNDVETLQHEINHGVGKRGNEPGGLAFGPRHYRSGMGKNIEEALTEETAHPLAAEWLRSHGMTDVLAAVKRNPHDHRVLGVYRNYRVQLRRILDDAQVPEGDRREMLERMKFQMSPEEQQAEILRLSGHDNIVSAMHGDAHRRSEMERNFEPILRPDLGDIDDSATAITTAGRTLTNGDRVIADDVDGGRSPGYVVGIRPGFVRVLYDDGTTLWIATERVE